MWSINLSATTSWRPSVSSRLENPSQAACDCAQSMIETMEHINAQLAERGLPSLRPSVGIAVGEVVAGTAWWLESALVYCHRCGGQSRLTAGVACARPRGRSVDGPPKLRAARRPALGHEGSSPNSPAWSRGAVDGVVRTEPRITLRQADLVRGGPPLSRGVPEESVHAACRILAAHGRLCVHGFDAPKTVDRIERRSASPRPEPKAKGPSALSEAPGEGERPELIDSSLAIELDNGRGGATVRVGVAFALHGLFAVDDAIRLRLMILVGVPWANPSAVLSERAAAAAATCRAKVDQRAGERLCARGRTVFVSSTCATTSRICCGKVASACSLAALGSASTRTTKRASTGLSLRGAG